MNPRLLVLIAIAAGVAIYFAAVKGSAKSAALPVDTSMTKAERDDVKTRQITLDKLDLPGSEPAEDSDLAVQVEVDRSKGKNRLYFTITEAHAFYVEQFQVRFWYVKGREIDSEDSLVKGVQFFDRFLPAKGTLRVCMEVVPAELEPIGGDMGDTSNWKAEIHWYGRARTKNPDPMPPRTDLINGTSTCD